MDASRQPQTAFLLMLLFRVSDARFGASDPLTEPYPSSVAAVAVIGVFSQLPCSTKPSYLLKRIGTRTRIRRLGGALGCAPRRDDIRLWRP